MKIRNFRALLVGFSVVSVIPGLVFAGAADMETTDGNHMKFEYEGSDLRINTGQEGAYMILNDNGMYVVNDSGGRLMVIDAAKMMGMFGDMAATAPSVAGSKVISLEATGQHEVFGGITGEIYNLEYFDEEADQVQMTQLVLSDDPRAIQLTKAITRMASSMTKAAGTSGQGVNELQKHMSSLNKGVLRYGNDMWVTRISDRTIASERFVLPAKPTDLSAMGDIFSQSGAVQTTTADTAEASAEKPKKKGLVSGFLSSFSKKADDQAERQQDRMDDKADEAVDDATDEAVDNVLDKALGKIFGN